MLESEYKTLGKLLSGSEESRLIAIEILKGRGLYNAVTVCACLNTVCPIKKPWKFHGMQLSLPMLYAWDGKAATKFYEIKP